MFRLPARRLAAPLIRTVRPSTLRRTPNARLNSTAAEYNLPNPPSRTRPPPTHRNPDNFVDHEALDRLERKALLIRRSVVFTALAIVGGTISWWMITTPKYHADTRADSPVFPDTSAPRIQTDGDKVALVPSGTSSVPDFPRSVQLHDGEYTLLGLGIRTVSFLSIQVYVVGFYVHTADLAEVQAGLLKRIHPEASSVTGPERGELRRLLVEEGETVVDALLKDTKFRSAMRIVPTRNTDFGHLRDGWVRGIQGRTREEETNGEDWGEVVKGFRAMFQGQGKVGKGKTLMLLRGKEGGLQVWFDETGRNDGLFGGEEKGRKIGEVADERIARYLWLTYLAGKTPASEPARQSVVEGLLEMASRPAGTLEQLPPVPTPVA